MGRVIRPFCWHQNFVSIGLSGLPLPWGYICIKAWKNMYKIRLYRDFLKLATNGQSDKTFLLASKFCLHWVVWSTPTLGLYIYVLKHGKLCIKSDFKEIFLKLATNGQSDKAFLLTTKFCPQRVVCICHGAIYIV